MDRERKIERILMKEVQEMQRAEHRARTKNCATRIRNGTQAKPRPRCVCPAYAFPHRPGGGLCRWPDPPAETWEGKPGQSKPSILRTNRGVRKRLAQKLQHRYGWHPIRDRQKLQRWLPKVYVATWRRQGWSYRPDLPAMRITGATDMFAVPPKWVPAGRIWAY